MILEWPILGCEIIFELHHMCSDPRRLPGFRHETFLSFQRGAPFCPVAVVPEENLVEIVFCPKGNVMT